MMSPDVSRGRQILTRFLTLAEERLTYLTELYETGRWQRYFTKDEMLENVRDAKKAVAAWKSLATIEAFPNNRAVDLGWLDSSRPLPPRKPLMLHSDQQSRLTAKPAAAAVAAPLPPAPPVSVVAPPVRVDFRDGLAPIRLQTPPPVHVSVLAAVTPPVTVVPKAPAWQDALNVSEMRQRYSLLRKAG